MSAKRLDQTSTPLPGTLAQQRRSPCSVDGVAGRVHLDGAQHTETCWWTGHGWNSGAPALAGAPDC